MREGWSGECVCGLVDFVLGKGGRGWVGDGDEVDGMVVVRRGGRFVLGMRMWGKGV